MINSNSNSDLKEIVRWQRHIVDNLPAMIAYWDKEQRCRFANKAYLMWFGFDPEVLIGRTMLELLGPELYEKNAVYINGALNGETQCFERDLRLSSTGELRHTNASYIPEIVDGKVLGFFVLVADVTELKKAQIAADSEKDRAHAAIKVREEILAVVSHDLKNPLVVIKVIATLLRRITQGDIARVQDLANRIQRASDQMQRLIEDLLDFAKIQSGTFSIEKLRVSPEEIVTSTIEGLKLLVQEKGQHLKTDIPSNLPDLECDAFRISQVLSNLLGNAIKFTPFAGTLTLKAELKQDEILFSVADTGPGVAPEQIPGIFDRFWQAQETRHLGSGLGLSIVKGIIESHGAKVWVESQKEKGATFFFTVPLATVETKDKYLNPDL